MPAKTQFVSKFREDQQVNDVFLVRQKQIAAGRTGRNYLRITLGDRSGQIEARVWEGAEEIGARFSQGDPVFVTGLVNSYQGVLQIKATYVEKLDQADASKLDWRDFLPCSERPASEMWAELGALLDTIREPALARLVDAFRGDMSFVEAFTFAPAAKAMHHAYVGGLLEHTLGCVKLADRLAPLYRLHRDLLLTGAFLHDIGKTKELDARSGFDYTDEGKLLGHIVTGILMLRERVAELKTFPDDVLLHLEHLILSHHGEMEWGSPKRPKTLEALALHAIDNMDAKLTAADKSIRDDVQDGDWTGFLKIFERPLFRRLPAQGDYADAAPEEPAQAKAAPAQAEPAPEAAGKAPEPAPAKAKAKTEPAEEPQEDGKKTGQPALF